MQEKKRKISVKEKSVLIFLAAQDFNEDEFIAVTNSAKQSGVKIFIASDAHSLCTGNKGLRIRPDVSTFNMKSVNFDGLVVIGGYGIEKYFENSSLLKLVKDFYNERKPLGAVCIAPVVLAKAGILKDRRAVCYPANKKELEMAGALFTDEPVVTDGNIVTARDPYAAEEFAESFLFLLRK